MVTRTTRTATLPSATRRGLARADSGIRPEGEGAAPGSVLGLGNDHVIEAILGLSAIKRAALAEVRR